MQRTVLCFQWTGNMQQFVTQPVSNNVLSLNAVRQKLKMDDNQTSSGDTVEFLWFCHRDAIVSTFFLPYLHTTFPGSRCCQWIPISRNRNEIEMWANAQRDGRPAKYRWRPLFNAAQFGWRPLLECRAVTLLRRETRWNLLGCPKLPNRSQPLLGRSSPYYEDMRRRYCCLTSFFDCRYMPSLQR